MKHILTDSERARIAKLLNLGMNTQETAEIVGVSKSTVNYIGQAYRACLAKDFDTLTRLYPAVKPTVEWACRFTNTEYNFEAPVPEKESKSVAVKESTESVPALITRNEVIAYYNALSDIRELLTEIRDLLK